VYCNLYKKTAGPPLFIIKNAEEEIFSKQNWFWAGYTPGGFFKNKF
jgi:hypothetical protein